MDLGLLSFHHVFQKSIGQLDTRPGVHDIYPLVQPQSPTAGLQVPLPLGYVTPIGSALIA